MDDSNFLAADFHIHTPASKCYRGENGDEEYISILKNYYNKDVHILAITDHNTIKGFREILRIQNEVEQKIKILKTYASKIPELQDELSDLEDTAKIFQELLILPGVEFEATPGIHLLFVFSPDQDLNEIENLLETTGYTSTIQGMETPECEVSVDVLDALKLAKDLNALTVAAHVDSNKGIYNDLNGNYRARVFKSEYLDGISVNNVVQIEKIRSLLEHKEYKRKKPLAIIQSSDHHEKIQCGTKLTYLQVRKKSFSEVHNCFKNPISKISPTEQPELKSIINRLANDKNTILLERIDYEEINKAACAVLNNNFGVVLIGITNDHYKNIKGIDPSEGIEDEIKESIIASITPEKIYYKLSTSQIPFGEKVLILIQLQTISEKYFFYNGKHLIYDNEKVTETTSEDLIKIAQKKSHSMLEEFHSNYDNRLFEITRELELLMESKKGIDIISKINHDGITLHDLFKVKLIQQKPEEKLSSKYPFGVVENNVFYVTPVNTRPNDCYLRCTCLALPEIEFIENNAFRGTHIVMVSGGGAHIIEEKMFNIYSAEEKSPSLLLKLRQEFTELNPYSIIAWLKSSIVLWYSYTLFGETNLYPPNVFKELKIPSCLFHNETSLLLEQKIKEIIKLERDFLNDQIELTDTITEENSGKNEKEIEQKAESHNRKIDCIALEIDQIINNKLELSDEESELIKEFLILKNIHSLELERECDL